jgi:hypothetical protein
MNFGKLSLITCVVAGSIGVCSPSLAYTANKIDGFSRIDRVRTVCDEYGRCWNEHRNAAAILGLDRRREYIGRWHDDDWRWRHRHYHHWEHEHDDDF